MNLRETKEYKNFGFSIVTCPICGAETLDTNWVCENCLWEYDGTTGEDEYSDPNGATVGEYRRQWQEKTKG